MSQEVPFGSDSNGASWVSSGCCQACAWRKGIGKIGVRLAFSHPVWEIESDWNFARVTENRGQTRIFLDLHASDALWQGPRRLSVENRGQTRGGEKVSGTVFLPSLRRALPGRSVFLILMTPEPVPQFAADVETEAD